MSSVPWWRDAVCYQVYVRSFADSDGDGVGDLQGVTSRLDYLTDLGVDAVWLTPFFRSPQADHGYDVADYREVDPLFGTLADFDELLEQAHGRGLKVIVDVVPNHSSDGHEWFQAALEAGPGSPERARYLFRDGRGDAGQEPPTNWRSVFGGVAWTQVPDGQWYLHLFDRRQPDFDWTNPDVVAEFEAVLRHWLDRGVDGFRIDVAHGLAKAPGLPDLTPEQLATDTAGSLDDALARAERPFWDQPAVHEVYRGWRQVLDSYDGDRMAIAEAWVATAEAMARYLRPDELQQAFNFHWLTALWSGKAMREVIAETFAATAPVGASATWVLSNHDVVRTPSRLGGADRARAAMLTMLALPGSAYLYQGEELGLPQVEVPPEHRQDPVFVNGHADGRDGCRVPLPWTSSTTDGSACGFSPRGSSAPWLPQPPTWEAWSAQAQRDDPGSSLTFTRAVLHLRRDLLARLSATVDVPELGEEVLVVRRRGADVGSSGLTCVAACGSAPVELEPLGVDSADVVLCSRADAIVEGALQPDTAAWFVPR